MQFSIRGDRLNIWVAYTVAAVSTTAFIILWFFVVRKELYAKQSMVEAAQCQLTACLEEYTHPKDGHEQAKVQEILKRSQSVYRQTVNIYNRTLRRPWNAIPAFFFGYRRKKDDFKLEQ